MTSLSPIENNQLQKKLHFLLDEYVDGKTYNKMWEPLMSLIEQALVEAQWQLLNRIDESIHQHTVPEGVGLLTRSYVKNTLEFERTKLRDNQGASNE